MGYQWQVIEEAKLGFGRLDGIVSGEDVLAAAKDFYHDPAWRPGYGLLWDNRGIKKLAIQPADVPEILRLASELPVYLGDGKAAAVIDGDLRMMGEHLIQMASLDEDQVRLFTSLENALAWLGVEDAALAEPAV